MLTYVATTYRGRAGTVSIILRDYQDDLKRQIYSAWSQGYRYVLAVCPTGGGKTAIMASVTNDCYGASCEIAHRQELVYQISMTLALAGVFHRIIAPLKLIKFIIGRQIRQFGQSFVHDGAHHTVASVDTLNARHESLVKWFPQVRLIQQDEGHHVLWSNKWGIAIRRFVNAWLAAYTATPCRSDRKTLRGGEIDGITQPGIYGTMVQGPTTRELINRGFLCDYKVYGPAPSIDTSNVAISAATGDFNQNQLRDAAHASTVTGDIVEHYLRIAPGQLGASFLVDVDQAAETTARYQAAGVPAELITSNTPDDVRVRIMDDFRCELVKQICNVDIMGEGVDVPGITVVSMGRPTESLGLYRQQAGRALRPKDGKPYGVIIDHVGNALRHGLPDKHIDWTLDVMPRPRRRKEGEDDLLVDENQLTTCRNKDVAGTGKPCLQYYKRVLAKCPHCGHVPTPAGRDRPEQVDGDLLEYSPALMQHLRGEAARIVGDAVIPYSGHAGVQVGALRNWQNRAHAQIQLRASIDQWAGIQVEVCGRSLSEAYRVFYARFGIDVATAQTEKLTAGQVLQLNDKIWEDINNDYSA